MASCGNRRTRPTARREFRAVHCRPQPMRARVASRLSSGLVLTSVYGAQQGTLGLD
jgi:hypothetical protein